MILAIFLAVHPILIPNLPLPGYSHSVAAHSVKVKKHPKPIRKHQAKVKS